MIEIKDLSYRYKRRRPPVLTDFNLTLQPGNVYGLLGPNGAGKSTLLYLIAGALIPASGSISVDGCCPDRRLPAMLSELMLVPEEVELPPVTLEEYVALNAPFYPRFDQETMHKCLEAFELAPSGRLTGMSMGQRKKAFISFAFACHTRVLLLDEPTNGLDIPGKAAFRSLCADLMTDDSLVVISTHQVRDLDRVIDRVLVMDTRRIIFDASIADIQERLCFETNADRSAIDDALQYIPSPGGFDVMTLNPYGAETEVNLELLFAYALHHTADLNRLFNHQPSPAL